MTLLSPGGHWPPLEFTPFASQVTFLALITATPLEESLADCRAPLSQEVDIFVGDKTGALAWWRFSMGEQPQHVANLTRDVTKAGHVQSLLYHRARQVGDQSFNFNFFYLYVLVNLRWVFFC